MKKFVKWSVCLILAICLFFDVQTSERVVAKAAKAQTSYEKQYKVSTNNTAYKKYMSKGSSTKLNIKKGNKKLNPRKVKFTSRNKKIATVDKNGVVHARKTGKTDINVRYKGQTCVIKLTVTKKFSRTVFIGDSRTVDMFEARKSQIKGAVHNHIQVFAKDGGTVQYAQDVITTLDWENYDTVVLWMGANDRGNFKPYEKLYNQLYGLGKRMILCTVGPVNEAVLTDEDLTFFSNGKIKNYNTNMKKWASAHGVGVVDLYPYIEENVNYSYDGIHYDPKPTTELWHHILNCIR